MNSAPIDNKLHLPEVGASKWKNLKPQKGIEKSDKFCFFFVISKVMTGCDYNFFSLSRYAINTLY